MTDPNLRPLGLAGTPLYEDIPPDEGIEVTVETISCPRCGGTRIEQQLITVSFASGAPSRKLLGTRTCLDCEEAPW